MKETLKKFSAGLPTSGVVGGKELTKKLSAGVLALAVVGGVGGLLTMSLASTQPKPAIEAAPVQTAIETVVVYGTKPADYASLVAHRKHVSAAGIQFAALQHR